MFEHGHDTITSVWEVVVRSQNFIVLDHESGALVGDVKIKAVAVLMCSSGRVEDQVMRIELIEDLGNEGTSACMWKSSSMRQELK